MTDYSDIILRLEEAEGPDQELDGHIAKHFKEMPNDARWMTEDVYGEKTAHWVSGGYGAYEFYYPKQYTASLDATVALIEKVGFPHYILDHRKIHSDEPMSAAKVMIGTEISTTRKRSYGANLAIALLIAMFKALQETRHDQP